MKKHQRRQNDAIGKARELRQDVDRAFGNTTTSKGSHREKPSDSLKRNTILTPRRLKVELILKGRRIGESDRTSRIFIRLKLKIVSSGVVRLVRITEFRI